MPPANRSQVVLLLMAAAAMFAAIPPALPHPFEIPILAVVLSYLPGALLARRIVPGWSRAGRALVALSLSPLLAGGAGAILICCGFDAATSARIVATVLALLSLASAWRTKENGDGAPADAPGDGIAWTAGIAWAVVIGAMLLLNRNLIPRSDGWYHAGVTLEVLQRGFPRESPFFAGLPIRYFWGPHAWAALWVGLHPSVGVWVPLVMMNLCGALASILGICLLARRLGAGRGGIAAAAVTAILACPPFTWGWIAEWWIRGHNPSLAGLGQMIGGIARAMSLMGTGLVHISLVFFGGKFLVLTFFGLGFAIFAAFFLAFVDLIAAPTPRRTIALAWIVAAALFLHAVIGFTCVALAAGWLAWAAVRAVGRENPRVRRAVLPLLVAVASGAMITVPYLATILGGKEMMSFGITREGIVTWLWGGALVLPAGTIWLARRRTRNDAALEILGLCVLLSLPAVLLVLTGNNQSKYFNLLFFVMSAPAGVAWFELLARTQGIRRWIVIAILAAATIPTVGIAFWAYAHDRGEFEFATRGGSSPLEAEAFGWARANTAPDAILIEEGTSCDAPVLAARSNLCGKAGWARMSGYAPGSVEIRRKVTARLCAAESLGAEERTFAAGLKRDLIVVAKRRSAGTPASSWNAIPRAGGAAYRPIYSNPDVVLYRWEGGR